MKKTFHLPDLGENIKGGDIVNVSVSVGDVIQLEQPLLEVETDKAVIEVPSGVAGTVVELHVQDGARLEVGAPILTVSDEEDAGKLSQADTVKIEQEHVEAPVSVTQKENPKKKPDLPVTPPSIEVREEKPLGPVAPASPSVRRLARELGVVINKVQGSGPGGRISEADVKLFVKGRMQSGGGEPLTVEAIELPDFSRWGEVEHVAMSKVRRATALHLSQAWKTVPHVTQHDKADITQLEELRSQYQKRLEKQGNDVPKLTMTAILIKVLAHALKVYPQFAASVDMARGEIVYKKYTHIGVAVDTDRGLLVPVIRDADRKNIVELAGELADVSQRARNRKTGPDELTGGVITITNLGGIGGKAFTPIVNHPETAILGVARGSIEPVWDGKQFQPRMMLPLSLSYDHRVIDGADGARFLRWLVEALEQPLLLALEG